MALIRIDIPIFYGENQAYGYVDGELEIPEEITDQVIFPWPSYLAEIYPAYFTSEQSKIMSISEWSLTKATKMVQLYGVSVLSKTDAVNCAYFFESHVHFSTHVHE